jgi:hypothetical protein
MEMYFENDGSNEPLDISIPYTTVIVERGKKIAAKYEKD